MSTSPPLSTIAKASVTTSWVDISKSGRNPVPSKKDLIHSFKHICIKGTFCNHFPSLAPVRQIYWTGGPSPIETCRREILMMGVRSEMHKWQKLGQGPPGHADMCVQKRFSDRGKMCGSSGSSPTLSDYVTSWSSKKGGVTCGGARERPALNTDHNWVIQATPNERHQRPREAWPCTAV